MGPYNGWILMLTALGLLAVAAAVVGALRLWHRRASPRLVLAIQESGVEPTPGPLNGPFVVVSVRNHSSHNPIQISTCALGIHRSAEVYREVATSNISFSPYELQPGRRFRFWAETAELAATLVDSHRRGVVEVVGVCYDLAGREYRSRPLRFHVERHLRAVVRAR